jgi:recombination protein RecA
MIHKSQIKQEKESKPSVQVDNKRLEMAIANIDKNFGKGTIVDFRAQADKSINRISSGSVGFDLALGGGWPCGRIVELYGPESSGKTTLALHAIVEAQKEGYPCAVIDAEHAFDAIYAEALGVDLSEKMFIFTQPDNGEQALTTAEELIKSGQVKIVVIDSVAALTPKAEIDGEFGESKMGLHARLMSQAMRKLNSTIFKNDCIVIFINQLRDKIGVMFGSPEITTGGNALKFYASIRVDVRRTGYEKDGEVFLASKTKVKVIKNKTFAPFRQAEFQIEYGAGIDVYREILDMASDEKVGIIKKSGSWYSYGDVKLGQGADSSKEILKDNPELYDEIKTKLLNKLLNLL